MDIQNILLLITAGVNFALALFVFLKNYKDKTNILFIILVLSLGIWSLSIAIFRDATDPDGLLFWAKMHFSAGVIIAYAFYYFTYFYPFVLKRDLPWKWGLHLILFIVALILAVWNKGYIDVYNSFTDVIVDRPKHFYFIAYFLYFSFSGFYLLYKKIRNYTGVVLNQLKVVFVATLIAGIFGIPFDVILTEFTYEYIYVGPYFTMAMAFIIYYQLFIKTEH